MLRVMDAEGYGLLESGITWFHCTQEVDEAQLVPDRKSNHTHACHTCCSVRENEQVPLACEVNTVSSQTHKRTLSWVHAHVSRLLQFGNTKEEMIKSNK